MAYRESDAVAPAAQPATRVGEILSADGVRRALTRMAHEVVEHHGSLDRIVVVGLSDSIYSFHRDAPFARGRFRGHGFYDPSVPVGPRIFILLSDSKFSLQ